MPRPLITLTSDFGTTDGYVASMKGVMLTICPEVTLVDISHHVPPRDVAHGAFVLGSAYCYFPAGTVHVAVVDPGVGSSRHPVLLTTRTHTFLAPDNGLLSHVLARYQQHPDPTLESGLSVETNASGFRVSVPDGCNAFVLDRSEYWLPNVSNTFHGRDIFAPVAAHLASGVRPESLGRPVDDLISFDLPIPRMEGDDIVGRIIFVDSFGNLVSNITLDPENISEAKVMIAGRQIDGMSRSYFDAPSQLLAMVGSLGYLEIAVNNGSAQEFLNVGVGAQVTVELAK